MTDQYYVTSGYVEAGYSAYVADGVAAISANATLTCEPRAQTFVTFTAFMDVSSTSTSKVTRIQEYASNLEVDTSKTARIGVIKKCDANLLLVDAIDDVHALRTRDVSISTEAIFTELAAVGRIGAFFINSQVNSELTANVHIISSGSASLDITNNISVVSSGLKDYRIQAVLTSELSALVTPLKDNRLHATIASEVTTTTSITKAYASFMDAFASELTVGDRTSDNRAALSLSTALTALDYRVRTVDSQMAAFASQLTVNIRIENSNAQLAVTTQQTTSETRIREFHSSMEAFAIDLTQGTNVKSLASNLQVSTSQSTRNTSIKDFNSHMEAFYTELSYASRKVVFTGSEQMDFVSTAKFNAKRSFTSPLETSSSLVVNPVVIKTLITNPITAATVTTRPYNFRGFDSQLTANATIAAIGTRTSDNQSSNVVTASLDAQDVRIRTAQIHTDVVATELAAFGKIGAFFINSQLNTYMSCDSHIIASGKSQLAVTATQTSRVEKNSDNRTNCAVSISSTCRNVRVSRGISNLVVTNQVNTSVSKVSSFNSQVTVDSTALTRLTKLSILHSEMLVEVTQSTHWIRRNFARSSMSTTVTSGSRISKISRNSSHMDVTAESVIWANRLKETVVDIHFNAAVQSSFRKFASVRVNPMAVSTNMTANGRLFYLDMRYGWNITPENRSFGIGSEDRNHLLEYEDRTFKIGAV